MAFHKSLVRRTYLFRRYVTYEASLLHGYYKARAYIHLRLYERYTFNQWPDGKQKKCFSHQGDILGDGLQAQIMPSCFNHSFFCSNLKGIHQVGSAKHCAGRAHEGQVTTLFC